MDFVLCVVLGRRLSNPSDFAEAREVQVDSHTKGEGISYSCAFGSTPPSARLAFFHEICMTLNIKEQHQNCLLFTPYQP